jgi:hypothetical protein
MHSEKGCIAWRILNVLNMSPIFYESQECLPFVLVILSEEEERAGLLHDHNVFDGDIIGGESKLNLKP